MNFVRTRVRGQVDRSSLKVVEPSLAVGRESCIRNRISQHAAFSAQRSVPLQDVAVDLVYLASVGARGPVNRSILEQAESSRPGRILAFRFIAGRISEEAALPSHLRPLAPDQAVDFMRACLRMPIDGA